MKDYISSHVFLIFILFTALSCTKDTDKTDLTESMESEHYIYYFSPGDNRIDTSWQEEYYDWMMHELDLQLDTKLEYYKYRDLGYEYAIRGDSYRDKSSKEAQEDFKKSLYYYNKALELTEDEVEKIRIESWIIQLKQIIK